ncbi:uncharacterized protein LOC125501015 isoform X2 [Athalia rosae]|uniref:uncharacterized protein LOC125501015 isoform X2 n=1 Tax=Athalia rosae TaxID=37344 RepID=UPI0020337E1A|nr:uncharacterized protein LOC125501015 isoform X2 [Athalia rosae]
MSRSERPDDTPEKVVIEKIGPHVEITVGRYTKRQLREMLVSSLSLLSRSGADRENDSVRLSGSEPEDVRRIRNGEDITDLEYGDESAALRLSDLISVEEGAKSGDLEKDIADLLRSKGISDDLIKKILSHGLTDELIRLLKALGFTDGDIALLLGMCNAVTERREDSSDETSCKSLSSSAAMTADGFYLMSEFRNPLTRALRDVLSKKPRNPTEYLGHWLLNYKVGFDLGISEGDDYDGEGKINEGVEDWNYIELETD